jgi:hypothetical protein
MGYIMSINTEIGGATANSYVSVASADQYLEARFNGDAWQRISENYGSTTATTVKENLLKQSTREIDRSYRFHNSKYNRGEKGDDDYQNLEFPRSNTVDTDGDPLIPDEIKFATYEQALWIMERQGVKTTDAGLPIQRELVNVDSYNYMKNWINRQVSLTGKYDWQGF